MGQDVLPITQVDVEPITTTHNLIGLAKVTIAGVIRLNGLRIFRVFPKGMAESRLEVRYPSHPQPYGKENEDRHLFYPLTQAMHEEIAAKVLGEYEHQKKLRIEAIKRAVPRKEN